MMLESACNLETEEAEMGRSLELTSQPILVSLIVNERPCLKWKKEQALKNHTWGCPLSSIYTCGHSGVSGDHFVSNALRCKTKYS